MTNSTEIITIEELCDRLQLPNVRGARSLVKELYEKGFYTPIWTVRRSFKRVRVEWPDICDALKNLNKSEDLE
jgi:hypothetical protein